MTRESINFAKMASNLDSNPKVRRAGRNAREVFLFVLRRVADSRAQGRIPSTYVDPWYLADQLLMTEAEAEEGITRACMPYRDGPGLLAIESDEVVVCGWDDEWGRYPLDEAERKRRQRARDKERAAPAELAEPARVLRLVPGVTECPDTSRDVRTVTDQIRSDQNSLSEIESGSSGPEPSAIGGGDQAQPLPDEWKPSDTDANLQAEVKAARKKIVVSFSLEKFREWVAERGAVAVDWDAAWRRWLLTEDPRRGPPVIDVAPSPQVAQAARDRERREEAERKQRAETDREEVRRAAKAVVASLGGNPNVEKTTK